ncbi:Uma2 family endonuclease [Candidatus Cyanaurora vandensis]|uniref:Uma2 family endonuclease n=1 Tax=Candidatus Cyanaurora vandensis TaxID=2714958 RepID=UPI00257E1058|nr:Uma2 family endonuclease [Candidatus Cyanaurora vandensis]
MQRQAIIYPTADGEPMAETEMHLWAMVTTLLVLRTYLQTLAQEQQTPPAQEGTVLANQFLYYEQGNPKARVAPDVMVVPGVARGSRDSYKIWEEGQLPAVVFEMTSKSTQQDDQVKKKDIYARLGVLEYWLFGPKGEWIKNQLLGYRLIEGVYQPIIDACSTVLGLRLAVEGAVISFYRLDLGEKLLSPDELVRTRLQAEQRAVQAEQRAEVLAARLRELGIDPDA